MHYDYDYDYDNDKKQDTTSVLMSITRCASGKCLLDFYTLRRLRAATIFLDSYNKSNGKFFMS
jgi:hypothetical protein